MHADIEGRVAATGLTRLVYAAANTVNGLRSALRSEAAVRQEVALIAIAVPLAIFIAPNPGWYVAMIASLFLLVAVELLNTAVEKLADHVTPDWNAKIGIVKDIGSAAVFMAILIAGLVWLVAAGLWLGIV